MNKAKKTAIMLALVFSATAIGSTAFATDGAAKPAVAAKVATKAATKVATKAPAVAADAAAAAPASQPATTDAAAQTPAPTPTNAPASIDKDSPLSMLTSMIGAAKSGKWALFVGVLLMLLTWLLNTLVGKKIPTSVLPWVAISLGAIGQGAFALAAGGAWLDAIVGGVSMGLTAAGSYSALFRHIPLLRSKKKAPAQAAAAVPVSEPEAEPKAEPKSDAKADPKSDAK